MPTPKKRKVRVTSAQPAPQQDQNAAKKGEEPVGKKRATDQSSAKSTDSAPSSSKDVSDKRIKSDPGSSGNSFVDNGMKIYTDAMLMSQDLAELFRPKEESPVKRQKTSSENDLGLSKLPETDGAKNHQVVIQGASGDKAKQNYDSAASNAVTASSNKPLAIEPSKSKPLAIEPSNSGESASNQDGAAENNSPTPSSSPR